VRRPWPLVLGIALVVGTGGGVLAATRHASCAVAFAGIVQGNNRATNVGLYDKKLHLCRRLTHDGQSYEASISPDGKRIAYVSGRGYSFDEELGNSHQSVYVMNIDGSHDRRLTKSNDYSPAWSPGGRLIAFEQHRAGTREFRLVVVDGGTGAIVRSKKTARNTSDYAWITPRRLAFATSIKGHDRSQVVDEITIPTGRQRRLLTLNSVDPVAISGRLGLVAYETNPGGAADIYVRPLAGGGHRLVPGVTSSDVWPAFWTNHDQLVFWNDTDLVSSLRGAGKPQLLKAKANDEDYTDDPHNAP
jgi:dipeptidyl aminopeptidase/acylaminoacyl peptidase